MYGKGARKHWTTIYCSRVYPILVSSDKKQWRKQTRGKQTKTPPWIPSLTLPQALGVHSSAAVRDFDIYLNAAFKQCARLSIKWLATNRKKKKKNDRLSVIYGDGQRMGVGFPPSLPKGEPLTRVKKRRKRPPMIWSWHGGHTDNKRTAVVAHIKEAPKTLKPCASIHTRQQDRHCSTQTWHTHKISHHTSIFRLCRCRCRR